MVNINTTIGLHPLSGCLQATGATFFCCMEPLVLNTEDGLREGAWGWVMALKYADISHLCVSFEAGYGWL